MPDPFAQYVVQDDPFAAYVASPDAPPQDEGSGGATAAMTAARLAPMAAQGVARAAANHPAATQKIIGAGIRTAAGTLGAMVGGVPGAVVGASIAGVTPKQTTIREVAGRLAGETPEVAKDAAKTLGITNYAKEYGVKVGPNDLIPKPNPANAIEHYANSTAEKGVLRIYGPGGDVVSGPSTAPALPVRPQPGILSRIGSVVGPTLARLQGASAFGDLVRTADPHRYNDVGFMGIAPTVPQPTKADAMKANATNQQRAEAQYRALLMAHLAGGQ